MSYKDWPERKRSVTNLRLDPRNARIHGIQENVSQRDLLKAMVEDFKVFELARMIVKYGYQPIEPLIGVEEKGHVYILEGNRRLSALKLLLSPDASPAAFVSRFRGLSANLDLDSIRKADVVIAPSRQAAYPIIMLKHTGVQLTEKWKPFMQAKFYYNLLQTTKLPVEDIAHQYHISPAEMVNALQSYSMYMIACSLDLPPEITAIVHDPTKFAFSTLTRLYDSPTVRDALGFRFDGPRVVGHIKKAEFVKGYSRVVSDIATKEVTSRSVNNKKGITKYLNDMGGDLPDVRKKGRFTTETLVSAEVTGAPVKLPPAKKKPVRRVSPHRQYLIPTKEACDLDNQRIQDIFIELQKKLRLSSAPNAIALSLRCLLEMALGYHLEKTGHIAVIRKAAALKAAQSGQRLRAHWHPTLKVMLKYVVDGQCPTIPGVQLSRAVNKLVTDPECMLSVDTLNLFVHNEHFAVDAARLVQFWAVLEGLFRIILVEPIEASG